MTLAQITGLTNPSTVFSDYNTLAGDFISRALLFVIIAAGLYFFYYLIISGISYMTSVGDEVRLKQIQKQLTNAVFGLLIVISAFFILQIIQTITGTRIL